MFCVVTGAAGFIGSQVIEALLEMGHQVRGIDCFTNYYPRSLKEKNLEFIMTKTNFSFFEQDIVKSDLTSLIDGAQVVIHLAAEAGIRSSWGNNFKIYTQNNLVATQRLLETIKAVGSGCRLVYASSSSVYGESKTLPSRETSSCWPVSPYGVTKLATEHLCSIYNKNFGLDIIILRYFTVYGPRQRPDMAFYRFIRAILEDTEIKLYGNGEQSRDFTYIDDVVRATINAALMPKLNVDVLNIGNGVRVSINQVLTILEKIINAKARVKHLEPAKGDVSHTLADTSRARAILGYNPQFNLTKGLTAEVEWISKQLAVTLS